MVLFFSFFEKRSERRREGFMSLVFEVLLLDGHMVMVQFVPA